MNIETNTEFSDEIADKHLELTVRHELEAEYPYRIKVGCIDEYLTERDVKRLRTMLSRAERVYKRLTR